MNLCVVHADVALALDPWGRPERHGRGGGERRGRNDAEDEGVGDGGVNGAYTSKSHAFLTGATSEDTRVSWSRVKVREEGGGATDDVGEERGWRTGRQRQGFQGKRRRTVDVETCSPAVLLVEPA